MYPISNDLLAIFQGGGMQYARLTIGNSTIGNDRIKQGSFSINRYVETNESVAIGSVVAAELVFVLDNYDGAYDNTDFVGTEAYVEIGVKDSNNTVQYVPMGYFTFDEATRTKNTISLSALDRMTKFDIPVNASDLSFPYTLTNLLSRICTLCSVTKGSFGTITNSSYSVASLPSEAKTYRDLLRWICELSGSNAYISYDGKLYLGWYGTTSQFNILPSNRTSSDIDKNTFTITGVTILTGDNQKYTAGTNVRPITINNNPFITTTQAQSVANTLNTKLGGFSYCPFTAVMLPSPMIYPMDRATFTTADGTTVAVSVTEVTYKLNGNTSIGCKGEMQVRGRSYGLADQTFYASNIAAGAVTADKISVDDLNALNATIANWHIGTDALYREVTISGTTYRVELLSPTSVTGDTPAFRVKKKASGASTYTDVAVIRYDGKMVSKDFEAIGAVHIAPDYDLQAQGVYAIQLDDYVGDWHTVINPDFANFCLDDGGNGFHIDGSLARITTGHGIQGQTKTEAGLENYGVDSTFVYAEEDVNGDRQTYKEGKLYPDDIVFEHRENGGTIYTDSLKRLTPHLAQMWSTVIPANANLNTTTYLKVGQYFCAQDTTVATLTNCPSTSAFNMTVEAPQSATYDDESGAYKYRVRKITSLLGDMWTQYAHKDSIGSSWTYGTWNRVATETTTSLNRTINALGEGSSPAQRNDYVIAQYAGGGTTYTNFYRRSVANILAALNSSDVTTALGYTPVNKVGDTMTGALNLTNSNINIESVSSENYVRLISSSGILLYLDMAASGHGLWSSGYGTSLTDGTTYTPSGSWIIFRDPTGYVRIPKWGNTGSSTKPIYFDTDGKPIACSTSLTDYVAKGGDTMSGNLTMDNKDVILTNGNAERTFRIDLNCGLKTYFLIGDSLNQGIYSNGYSTSATDTTKFTSSAAYIIRRGTDGKVYIPLWASKGSSSTPVYFDSNGYPTACSLPTYVSSVAVTGSKGISVSGSPVTSSGTIDVSVSTSSGTATRNTTNTSAGEVKYQKYGRVVTIYTTSQITVTSTGAAANKTYFSGLPKPSANVTFTGTGPSNKAVSLMITTDGYLQGVFNAPPSGVLTVGTTYIAAS